MTLERFRINFWPFASGFYACQGCLFIDTKEWKLGTLFILISIGAFFLFDQRSEVKK